MYNPYNLEVLALSIFNQIKTFLVVTTLCISPLAPAFAGSVAIADLSPAQVLEVTEKFISTNKPKDALGVAKAWHPENPSHKSLEAHVRARLLEEQGDIGGAIKAYRAILVVEPKFRPARFALARALTVSGDDEAAKFQLENLLAASSGGASDDQLKRMLSTINSREPVKYGFYASLLPSTNINTATDNKTAFLNGIPFVINETRKSGIGMIMGGWVTYNQKFTLTNTFLASASLDHRFYPSAKAHLTSVNVTAGVAHEAATFKVTGTIIAGGEFGDFKPTSKYIGARLDGSKPIGGNWMLRPFFEVKHQQYEANSLKDSWAYSGRFTFDKSITATRSLRLFVGGELNRAKAARFSYDDALVGIGGYNEFGVGVSIYAEASVAKRKYKALGPGLTSLRNDTRWQARGVFTKRDLNIFGLAPQLSYTFTRNVSNSVFDDYKKHDFDIRMTKAF